MHSRLLRVTERGRILEELSTEVGVFACMLGGEDGRTLFACVAPSFREREAAVHHRLGADEKGQSPPRRRALMRARLHLEENSIFHYAHGTSD